MVQQMCSASTLTRRGLFSPAGAPSKLYTLTVEGHHVAFGVSNNFQKLGATDYKPFNVNLSAGYNSQRSRFLVTAGSGIPLESGPESSSSPNSIWESVEHGADVFYRFTKPYVIIAKIIEVLSMSLLAMDKLSDFSPLYVKGVLKAMVAASLMCMYICGLNQLTDIEIDKINKPFRPLASGEYSYKTGSLIVAVSIISCFAIAWFEGSWPLIGLHFGQFIVGSLYSITINFPLLRWQRSAFFASFWMVTFYGVIQPVCYYLHFQTHFLQKPYVFSRSLMFISAFMSFLSIILTAVKDIPDVEGDSKFGVESFAMRFGRKRVFWTCVIGLEIIYGAAICVGAMSPNPWSKLIMILGHSVMAVRLWNCAKQTDITNQDSSEAFYMFLCYSTQNTFSFLSSDSDTCSRKKYLSLNCFSQFYVP